MQCIYVALSLILVDYCSLREQWTHVRRFEQVMDMLVATFKEVWDCLRSLHVIISPNGSVWFSNN